MEATKKIEKEVAVRTNISTHDLDMKINKAREFLAKGKVVTVVVQIIQPKRGEPVLGSRAKEIIGQFIHKVSDLGEESKDLRREQKGAFFATFFPLTKR